MFIDEARSTIAVFRLFFFSFQSKLNLGHSDKKKKKKKIYWSKADTNKNSRDYYYTIPVCIWKTEGCKELFSLNVSPNRARLYELAVSLV